MVIAGAAVQAKLACIADVSDVTLLNRLRHAEDWLRQLCQQLWRQTAPHGREPGETGGQWRIHYSVRLPLLECDHCEVTPVRGKNNGENLGRFAFHAGELVLADAGYCHPLGVEAVVRAQADICVRLNPASFPLGDARRRRFPLMQRIRTLQKSGKTAEWPVWVNVGEQRIAGRICAVRKSEEAIRRARRRLRRPCGFSRRLRNFLPKSGFRW